MSGGPAQMRQASSVAAETIFDVRSGTRNLGVGQCDLGALGSTPVDTKYRRTTKIAHSKVHATNLSLMVDTRPGERSYRIPAMES